MALAETAELAVKLTLGGNFIREMGKVNRSLAGFDKGSSRAFRAGQQIGTGLKRGATIAAAGAGLLATQVAAGLDSLIKLEQATTQTNAVIKSTQGAAGQTAESIRNLAEKYEALNATVGDEVIQSGENVLLTFTAIRKEGFEPALAAALDMSTALGKDLQSSILMVGKALQDPIGGLTALKKAGVNVTGELKEQITSQFKLTKEELKHYQSLQKSDKAAAKRYLAQKRDIATQKAQKIILAELNKEFGGSFIAGGTTTAGKVAKFTDAIEDLQRSLATALLPTVSNVADALSELLRDPEVIRGVEQLGQDIGKLFSKDNIKAGAKFLKDAFTAIRGAAGPIRDALGAVAGVLKGAFDAFRSLPEPIQQLLIGGAVVNKLTGGLVTNIAGGIFGALKAMTVQAAVVNVNGGIVNGGGGLPGIGGAAGGGGLLATASSLIVPVSIAAISVAAAGALGNAIDPSATAPGRETLGNRDPRRFNSAGQVVQNSVPIVKAIGLLSDKDEKANAKQAAAQEKTRTAVETMRGNMSQDLSGISREAQMTKVEAQRGLALVDQSTRSGTSQIVGAIYANRPVITVNSSISATSVTKTSTVIRRYGSVAGSRDGGGGNIREGAD